MHSYDPIAENHGLRHDPMKALVMPRPIGWISTLNADGKPNLAPYSFFNLVNDQPYQIMMASNGQKDSLSNVESTGEMVFNGVSHQQLDAMNLSSLATQEDEFVIAGLDKLPSTRVAPYRVAGAPWHLECVLDQIVDLKSPPGKRHAMIIATAVQVHIGANLIQDGVIDQARLRTIARCGYRDYADIDHLFALDRPSVGR